MFGLVMADVKELTKEQKARYNRIYCGICRQIRLRASGAARLGLRYDLAFLSMLLMSLYEPEETSGDRACGFHPLRPRPWVDNVYIAYGADMNVALAYYNAQDDYADEGKLSSKLAAGLFGKEMEAIAQAYPRQCAAITRQLGKLRELESANCPEPDAPAACFGALLGELFVYDPEDYWASKLRQIGDALGRFIYLADAAIDYHKDKQKNQYNPFVAMGQAEDWSAWEEYLVLSLGRCTQYYEQLPLVQDKAILDNILYGGIWLLYRQKQKRWEGKHDRPV